MQVTAIIKNNTLIIPNVDLSQLAPYADHHSMIEFDPDILTMLVKPKSTQEKLSLNELLQKMTIKTNKVATVEEMNESIAKAYENREV